MTAADAADARAELQPRRCDWVGFTDPLYHRYHDDEWGVPLTDDQRLFEKIILEGFQSGLSWLTILRKREAFRKAFHDFNPQAVARFGERDITRLMGDAGIVRHRAKIEAAIGNARAFLALTETQSYAQCYWGFVDGRPIINHHRSQADIPTETDLSRRIAMELKARGFRFVGSTTLYANMQSTGMVNDHLVSCHRHAPCAKLQRAFAL